MSSNPFPWLDNAAERLMPLVASIPPRANPAELAFETIAQKIAAFEKTLNNTEAVGTLLASFGQSILLSIHRVSRAGQFICMEGLTSNGDEASLVQHYTQTSLLLLKVKAEEPRRPIGFNTQE